MSVEHYSSWGLRLRGWAVSLSLILFVGALPGWADLAPGRLSLTSEESGDLRHYQSELDHLIKVTEQIKRFDDDLALREAKSIGNLESVMTGLRQDFKNAAVNCTLAALKNATKIDQILQKLPPGSLKGKLSRVLQGEKAQKLLKTAEKVGEAVEQGLEQAEEIQGEIERVNEFLETSQNEGVREAVRQDLLNAVRSEIENIFPLDLDQPPNEVVVDGFIELSKHFPATAPFTGIFETTAAVTKKLVRVYEQNLHFDAIEENRRDFQPIRLRHNENRNKFVDDPVHARMLRNLDGRLSLLATVSLKKTDSLQSLDFAGLRQALSRYVSLPFLAARNFHDCAALQRRVRSLAERFRDVERSFEALERQRRQEDQKRAEEDRRRIQEEISSGKNRPTGRSYFARAGGNYGLGGGLQVRLVGGGFAGSSRRSSRFVLGLDQISRDLTGGGTGLEVEAWRRKFLEVVSNTSLSGRPSCGNWRRVNWVYGGIENALGRVRISGPLSLSGSDLKASGPGEGEISLLVQSLGTPSKASMPVKFSWQETEPTGRRDHNGRPLTRTVTKTQSQGCEYQRHQVKEESPDRVRVQIYRLDRFEVRDRTGALFEDGTVFDFDPQFEVKAILDGGEVLEKRLGQIEEGSTEAGFVVKEETPRPVTGNQKMQFWIQDSTGKKLLTRSYSINRFRMKLSLEGEQVPEPSLDLEAYLFGPGKLTLEFEGPVNDDAWTVEWGLYVQPKNFSLPGDLAQGRAVVDILRTSADHRDSWYFRPELKHKQSGLSCFFLIPELKRISASVFLRAPRLQSMEVRDQVGGTVGLGGEAHGVHFFTVEQNSHGSSLKTRRNAVYEAVFVDEFGGRYTAKDPLPGGIRLKDSVFEVDAGGGASSSILASAYRRTLSVRPGSGPGVLKVGLIQPQFEWGSRDHRLIFHPDFDFSQRDFLILNTVVTVAQTVDFERGRLAMMMVLDGPGNYDGFEVAWPTRGGDTIRTGFSPYKTGVASSIPMEDIMRFREAHVLNAAGDTATSVLLRYFKQEEATRVIQRPTFREFLRPEAFLAGEVNPLVAVIQDLDPFGAVSLQCQWHVAGSVGELLDGEETSPELDASLNLYRCTNRLRLPGDAKVGGVAPRVTLHLVQEGR